MKPHLLGILHCSLIAAVLGFGTVALFNYGFTEAPASVSRRFVEYGYGPLLLVVRTFYFPLSWDWMFCAQSPWIAASVAAVIWGTVAHFGLKLVQFSRQRLREEQPPYDARA